jgi:MacB-like periplasmic core domain
MLRLLGVAPVLGRSFDSGDATQGADRLALISHGLWTTAFGAMPSAVGATVTLDNRTYTIVGVMPRTFAFPGRDVQIWLPLTTEESFPSPVARRIQPDYFATLGIPLFEGRVFDTADRAGSPLVVAIDRQTARHLWADTSAVGQRLKVGRSWRTVVAGFMNDTDYGRSYFEKSGLLENLSSLIASHFSPRRFRESRALSVLSPLVRFISPLISLSVAFKSK